MMHDGGTTAGDSERRTKAERIARTGDRQSDYPAEYGLETRWVEARDGTRLRVLVGGDVEAPRLLCVHGFPQNAAEWRALLPFVRDRFRVLLVDLRGYGKSELARTGDYSLSTLVDDLVTVLEASRAWGGSTGSASGPAHLVAHDWGGAIAWALVRSRPDLVAHFVAVNAPDGDAYTQELTSSTEQLKSSWYTFLFQIPFIEHAIASNGASMLVRTLKGSSIRGTFTDEDVELYVAPLRDPARMRAALSYYRAAAKALVAKAGDRRRGEPPRAVEVPTIVVWGERDEAIRRGVVDRMMREVCPSADLRLLPDSTHWVPDERPDAVGEAIVDGLERSGHRFRIQRE